MEQTEPVSICPMVSLGDGAVVQKEADKPAPSERERWSSRFDYILTMVGYCVGFGNLWRFPYICNRNGGGAFLIPFLLFLFVIGFPMFYLETSLSQFSGKNAIQVWSFCPMCKGVSIGSTFLTMFYMVFYNILLAWSIYYMIKSCNSVLPWTTCDNNWNTDLCVEDITGLATNTTNGTVVNETGQENDIQSVAELWKNKTLKHTAVEEFWQYNVLNVSSGLEEIGSVQWSIVGCLFAANLIIFLCTMKGVKSSGKVVYVTALLPYLLLIVILIRALLTPGSGKGILYFLTPDFAKLLHIQVWLEAALQVFYSLGPGWGAVGTAASYNKFNEPCLKNSLVLVAVSEGTSIFAGLVIFSVLGIMSEKLGVEISEVVSSGPGLGFVTYPEALKLLPLPQLWSFLFFFMLLSVGLDTQFMNAEVVSTAIVDRYPRLFRKRRWIVSGAICAVGFLVGIIFCTQGGQYMFQLLDWYVASIAVFVFCTCETLSVAWAYGLQQMSKDTEMMLGRSVPTIINFMWAYITPLVFVLALVLTLHQYQPPTYGLYKFPFYSSIIGWILAALPLIPVPVFMILAIRRWRINGYSFSESVGLALRPDSKWGPSEEKFKEEHKESLKTRHSSLRENVRFMFK